MCDFFINAMRSCTILTTFYKYSTRIRKNKIYLLLERGKHSGFKLPLFKPEKNNSIEHES